MAGLLIFTAILLGLYRDNIKGVQSYALTIENPRIEYKLTGNDDNSNSFTEIKYVPHISSFTGFSVTQKDLTLSVAFQNQDDDKKGVKETNLFDVQLLRTYKNYLWEIYYQNYQGLYITDRDSLSSDLARANSYSYGLGVKHFFRQGFELDHSQGNFSLKKETNWSWILGAHTDKSKLYSNKSLIPTAYQSNFSQLKDLKALDTFNLGIDAGIAGLVTKYQFFASALLTLGPQYQKQSFSGIDQTDRAVTTINTFIALAMGYRWHQNTYGAELRGQTIESPVKDSIFTQSRYSLELYYKYFF